MKISAIIPAAISLLFLTAVESSNAGFVTYFHMDGLPGDGNQLLGHSDDSSISTFGWSVTTNTPGQPAFTLTLQKQVSVNSPVLAADCANGVVNPTATLACFKAAGGSGGSAYSSTSFYSLILTNVQVVSVTLTNDTSSEALDETVKLQFSAIQWTYTPQNPDGSYGTPIVTSYSSP